VYRKNLRSQIWREYLWARKFGAKSSGNMNKAKDMSNTNGKQFLRSAFSAEQEVLRVKLKLSSASITHNGVMGDVNEQHFIAFLKKSLPKRYAVESAIVIDSNGNTSDQIDIVIFDNQYTPTLLDQHDHRFVPAEAVYAVFEVKPVINKGYLEYASKKAESVRKLERTSIPIKHAGGEYPAKPLFPIVAGIVAADIEWAEGLNSRAFIDNIESFSDDSFLDCGLVLSGGCFDFFREELLLGPKTNSLAYFLFRLLEKLQGLGTVPATDWNKYAIVISEENA
jgi:hypothetical protein